MLPLFIIEKINITDRIYKEIYDTSQALTYNIFFKRYD